MKRNKNNGFTLVELLVVIAILAILGTVSIVGYTSFTKKAYQSNALNEAIQKWREVTANNLCTFTTFKDEVMEDSGWYYDIDSALAKYNYQDKYTVTYDGKEYKVIDYDHSDWRWGYIKTPSLDYKTYTIDNNIRSLVLTYYDSINSRGFSWMSSTTLTQTKLYIVESNLGENADFSSVTPIEGSYVQVNAYDAKHTSYNAHKVHVTGLNYNSIYSYKVGDGTNWKYGVFKTEQENPNLIRVVQLSDSQTIDQELLNLWENTFAQAIETAGRKLDFVTFNGDQFDTNIAKLDSKYESFDREERFAISREMISKYIDSKPYMSGIGNHEPLNDTPKIHYYNSDIDFGYKGEDASGYDSNYQQGGYYSFDYGDAHFVVLGASGTAVGTEQIKWLESDLSSSSAKWKIVQMHVGPYSTGDNCKSSVVDSNVKNLTPLFSKYHVDLVLQGHDHTYSKTLPYKWDAAGYSSTYDNSNVVNFNPTTTTIDGESYDVNPEGTYYVCTGASGHRIGESEKESGDWAEVTGTGNSSSLSPLIDNDQSFLTKRKYKLEVGKINKSNTYQSYVNGSKTCDQVYNIGDPATGNVNAQMFGILDINNDTLSYKFYTVNENDVRLFDTLNIKKIGYTKAKAA